jgi:hypothetical protein
MVSLQTEALIKGESETSVARESAREQMKTHPSWQEGKGWKSTLNNLRLFLQPHYSFNLLKPWLSVFFSPRVLHLFENFPRSILSGHFLE